MVTFDKRDVEWGNQLVREGTRLKPPLVKDPLVTQFIYIYYI